MPTVDIDGIATHYEISGSGPAILMMAPGGFDSAIEKWSTTWPWQHFLPLQTFAREYTCVADDRREAGQSGGRVEQLTWTGYADQAKGLLDHLGIDSAFIMGSCLGASPVIAFAARYPEACQGLVIAQPSGGVKRRLTAHRHFNLHRQYAQDNGLEAVVERARVKGSFPQDPEARPWAAVLAHDTQFAAQFVRQDVERYLALVTVSCQSLFDRDTIPGAEPEELMALKLPALILPGHTDFHATSCARYLEECIPGAEYWEVHLSEASPPDGWLGGGYTILTYTRSRERTPWTLDCRANMRSSSGEAGESAKPLPRSWPVKGLTWPLRPALKSHWSRQLGNCQQRRDGA